MDASTPLPRLTPHDLAALARESEAAAPCAVCAALVCPGWESMPSSFDRASLRRAGMLRDAADEEPTFAEHHPAGSHAWSVDAPIAPAFFPYNRCEVWQCVACARAYLRYTEYGGYYEDERIRALNPALIDDTTP
ncbi:MAG TPA: hypothetical protein VLA16_26490 [Ideonella sp.]|nr:hypothetical protein [Ideonella sp.]